MTAVGRAMGEGKSEGAVGALLSQHADVLARVAMALVGDASEVERVLEQVAREAGARPAPEDAAPLPWLLGLVRTASATQRSKLPLRSRVIDEQAGASA